MEELAVSLRLNSSSSNAIASSAEYSFNTNAIILGSIDSSAPLPKAPNRRRRVQHKLARINLRSASGAIEFAASNDLRPLTSGSFAALTSPGETLEGSDLSRLARRPSAENGMRSTLKRVYKAESRVQRPEKWIALAERLIRMAGMTWRSPTVCQDGDHLVVQWWNEERKVSAYIGPSDSEIMCIWGVNIDTQMRSVADVSPRALLAAWRWLVTADAP